MQRYNLHLNRFINTGFKMTHGNYGDAANGDVSPLLQLLLALAAGYLLACC